MTRRALVACEMSGEVRNALVDTGYWDEVWSADFLPTEKRPLATVMPGGMRVTETTDDGTEAKGYHYLGNVLDLFEWEHPVNGDRFIDGQCNYISPDTPLWDLVIGHPPCDHLASAGARYWKEKDAERGGNGDMQRGADFFMKMVRAPARYVAVENPRGIMGRKRDPWYRVPDQVVEPFWFGDPLEKKTCLWLKNLPALTASNLVEPTGRVATGGGSHRTDTRNGRTAMNRVHEDRRGREFRKIERSRTMPGFARAMAVQWTGYIREHEAA